MMITCIFSLLHNSMYKIKLWQQNLNWRNQSTRLSVEGSMYNNVMIVVNYGKYIPPKVRLLRDVGWPAQCPILPNSCSTLHYSTTRRLDNCVVFETLDDVVICADVSVRISPVRHVGSDQKLYTSAYGMETHMHASPGVDMQPTLLKDALSGFVQLIVRLNRMPTNHFAKRINIESLSIRWSF